MAERNTGPNLTMKYWDPTLICPRSPKTRNTSPKPNPMAQLLEEVKKCVEQLSLGKLILYPTDTLWGIGCDATDPEAVKKISALKEREDTKSLICLVSDQAMLER